MRPVRMSEDVVTVSEFKAQTADLLRKAATTGAPIVVTQNGRPAGVLLSPAAYDELTEQARFLTAVQRGLADGEAGRVRPHAEVVKAMKRRYGRKRDDA